MTAIKSVPCLISSMDIVAPFISVYFTSRRRLLDIAGNVSLSNCVRVMRSTLNAPLPSFFIIILPEAGEVDSSFVNTALADFTTGCCFPFQVQVKSRVPESFSARRPIAINEKAVDCVLNQFSSAKFLDTFFACCNAAWSRFIRSKVSSIIASSRSYEP